MAEIFGTVLFIIEAKEKRRLVLRKCLNFVAYVCILVLSFSQLGCTSANNANNIEPLEENDYKFGLTREQFNIDFGFPGEENVLKIADGMMNGQLTVIDVIESTEYDIENIDWNINFTESKGTFQLYLQCLNPIHILLKRVK